MRKNEPPFAINEKGEMYFKYLVYRQKRIAEIDTPVDQPEVAEPEMIVLSDLLQCLVECSEKAAKIAQIFRDENDLFDVLIQEKCKSEANSRFAHDFKTLADVLVQETIKKDVGQKYPDLITNIHGEEVNSFKNKNGESVKIKLTDDVDQTINMLVGVLDGRKKIAKAVADIVHSTEIVCERQSFSRSVVFPATLRIWIDPIDSTAEFIEGNYDETEECGMQPYGLKCVCVLIGVFNKETHTPILGVINQPFHYKESEDAKWESKFYWGINYGTDTIVSRTIPVKRGSLISREQMTVDLDAVFTRLTVDKDKIVVISTSEKPDLQEILKERYTVVHAAGAGHKALLVACQKADLYVLSQSTTFFWDTCGPHAILRAAGGGILRFDASINDIERKDLDFLERKQLLYYPSTNRKDEEKRISAYCNTGGIIAYRDPLVAVRFICHLIDKGYLAR